MRASRRARTQHSRCRTSPRSPRALLRPFSAGPQERARDLPPTRARCGRGFDAPSLRCFSRGPCMTTLRDLASSAAPPRRSYSRRLEVPSDPHERFATCPRAGRAEGLGAPRCASPPRPPPCAAGSFAPPSPHVSFSLLPDAPPRVFLAECHTVAGYWSPPPPFFYAFPVGWLSLLFAPTA